MRRAVIYVRISRDISGQALGVARQEHDCRELAGKRGWQVVAVRSDNDISATSGKRRPGWEAVLRDIESGKVGALVAYSSSRMYRRPADLQRLIALVKERPGFQIATVASGPISLDSADQRMIAGILAEVDQAEVERLRERVTRARKGRVEAGKDAGGSRPFGYEAVPTGSPRERDGEPRLQLTGEIVPEEAALIREAAQRLLRGEPVRRVLRDWEERDIKTPKGNRWRPVTLRHMLRNPRLIGVHPETGERAGWKPILDRRSHEALVEMYADPSRLRSRRSERWLLTGLLYCGICGGKLTARPSPDHRRYTCDATSRAHLSISAEPLEVFVVDEAMETAPKYTEPTVADPAGSANGILAQLDEVDAKLAAWAREAAAAGLRASEIRAGAGPLAAERDRLESKLADIHPVQETWSFLQHDRVMAATRAWLEAVIERITVNPATTKGRRFDPGRVEIVWR